METFACLNMFFCKREIPTCIKKFEGEENPSVWWCMLGRSVSRGPGPVLWCQKVLSTLQAVIDSGVAGTLTNVSERKGTM